MKVGLILSAVAASIFIFTGCNNGSDHTTTNSDTSTSIKDTPTTQLSTAPESSMLRKDLMTSMGEMAAKMQSMQMTGDFDVDFANMMIEHHQGAIDMADFEIASGSDEKLKSMAQKIITKQRDEQEMLRDFVKNYKSSAMKHGEGELKKSMSEMSGKMKSMQMSGNVDKDFANMMASHHQDGISMAKMELKNGMSDKLKQMAQKEISDQQKDIVEFKSWLTKNK